MAQKKTWIGSVGPLLYDDADEYDPVNEPGVTMHGVRTDGAVAGKTLEGNLQGYNEGLKRSFLL